MIIMHVRKIIVILGVDVFTLIFPTNVYLLICVMMLIVIKIWDVSLLIPLTDVGMMICVILIDVMMKLDVYPLLFGAMTMMLVLMTGVTLIRDAYILTSKTIMKMPA
jgi:hypothetical protein